MVNQSVEMIVHTLPTSIDVEVEIRREKEVHNLLINSILFQLFLDGENPPQDQTTKVRLKKFTKI